MAKAAKTHSGAKKRFKITKNKKVIACKSCNNHLLTNKGKNNKKSPYGKTIIGKRARILKDLVS